MHFLKLIARACRSGAVVVAAHVVASLPASEPTAPAYARLGPVAAGGVTVVGEHYLAATDYMPGTLSLFRRDETSGLLTPLGEPVPLGRHAGNVASDSKGRWLYVAAGALDGPDVQRLGPSIVPVPLHVLAFDAAPETASVVQTLKLERTPLFLAIDPLDRFVFVVAAASDREIHTFRIAPDTGTLTATGKPVRIEGDHIIVDPLGRFVYDASTARATCYRIDPANGALTETGKFDPSPYQIIPGLSPYGVLVGLEPRGRFAFIVLEGKVLAVFTVDPQTGLFAPTSHLLDITGNTILQLAFTADERRIYAAADGTVLELSFNPDTGDLGLRGGTLNPNHECAAPSHAWQLALDPGGRFLHVVGAQSAIFGYRIDAATGELTRLGVPEVPCFVPYVAVAFQQGATDFVTSLIANRGGPILDGNIPPPERTIADAELKYRYESDPTHPTILLPHDRLADYLRSSGTMDSLSYMVLAVGRKDGRVYKFGGPGGSSFDVLAQNLDEIPPQELLRQFNPSAAIRARVLHARPHGEGATLTDGPDGKKTLRYTLWNLGVAGDELSYVVTPMPAINVPQIAPFDLPVDLWIWIGEGAQSNAAAIFDLQPGGIATWVFVPPDIARYLAEPHPPAA